MSSALEHSPIRYSKTVALLGIFAAVRYGFLRSEQIVLVALFGTTSGSPSSIQLWNATARSNRNLHPAGACVALRCIQRYGAGLQPYCAVAEVSCTIVE